jgi:hypothetical protein
MPSSEVALGITFAKNMNPPSSPSGSVASSRKRDRDNEDESAEVVRDDEAVEAPFALEDEDVPFAASDLSEGEDLYGEDLGR